MASINLTKRSEKVGISLAKRGMQTAPIMKVGAAFDVSGSTRSMFRDGTMQETFDRLLAVSMKFDDDGQLDIWTFDDQSNFVGTASDTDEGTYVQRRIVDNDVISKWGGTRYGSALKSVVDFYNPSKVQASVKKASGFLGGLFFKKSEPEPVTASSTGSSSIPAMLMFLTDGDNSDDSETVSVLDSMKNSNIYVQMIGVGTGSDFNKLKKYADKFDHVGFVKLSSLNISDEQLFDSLITQELVDWNKSVTATV